MLCDPNAEFGAVFGTRAFEARFEFVYGFFLGGANTEAKARRNMVRANRRMAVVS